MPPSITIAITLLVVAGCTNGKTSSSSSNDNPPSSPEACMQGWYLNPPAFPSCVCSGNTQPAECQFSDCTRYTYIGFQASTYFSGELSYSLTGRVMSGNASQIAFTKTDTGYQIPQTGFNGIVVCSSSGMQVNDVNHIRPPDEIAAGLSATAGAGKSSWAGYAWQ